MDGIKLHNGVIVVADMLDRATFYVAGSSIGWGETTRTTIRDRITDKPRIRPDDELVIVFKDKTLPHYSVEGEPARRIRSELLAENVRVDLG